MSAKFKAKPGRYLVAIEDPFDGDIDVVQGMEDVERDTAMEYAETENRKRGSAIDCVYWVFDDSGFCINQGPSVSR